MTAYFTHDDVSESIYLNDDASCSINSLIEISGLSQQQLDALIDVGIVVPMNDLALPYFHLHYIVTTQIARRLIDDFELDLNGML